MDRFDPKIHLFCTPDGRAQDRIPGDIQELATQEGTRISADMVNAWTNEIVNTIKGCGIVPDREKENQLAEAVQKRLIYDNVCKIKTYLSSTSHIPDTEAILDGRTLYGSNYEDNLAELRRRCPSSWVSGSNVTLPRLIGYYPRFSTQRQAGNLQEDAMHEMELKVTSKISSKGKQRVSIPGEITSKCSPKPSSGVIAGLYQPTKIRSDTSWHFDVYRTEDQEYRISDNVSGNITPTVSQEGNITTENRPKNFNVLMTIIVGVPKKS